MFEWFRPSPAGTACAARGRSPRRRARSRRRRARTGGAVDLAVEVEWAARSCGRGGARTVIRGWSAYPGSSEATRSDQATGGPSSTSWSTTAAVSVFEWGASEGRSVVTAWGTVHVAQAGDAGPRPAVVPLDGHGDHRGCPSSRGAGRASPGAARTGIPLFRGPGDDRRVDRRARRPGPSSSTVDGAGDDAAIVAPGPLGRRSTEPRLDGARPGSGALDGPGTSDRRASRCSTGRGRALPRRGRPGHGPAGTDPRSPPRAGPRPRRCPRSRPATVRRGVRTHHGSRARGRPGVGSSRAAAEGVPFGMMGETIRPPAPSEPGAHPRRPAAPQS